MKAFSKKVVTSYSNIGNKSSLISFINITSCRFSDWASNGVVGTTITRQVRENFVSPNGFAIFNSAGHRKVKAKFEKVDNTKDFPTNSARLNFLKGKK
jgi:hypothetical protein